MKDHLLFLEVNHLDTPASATHHKSWHTQAAYERTDKALVRRGKRVTWVTRGTDPWPWLGRSAQPAPVLRDEVCMCVLCVYKMRVSVHAGDGLDIPRTQPRLPRRFLRTQKGRNLNGCDHN